MEGEKKIVEFVDLVKRFPTHIWTQESGSIQRTDRLKFGADTWQWNIFYSLLNGHASRTPAKEEHDGRSEPSPLKL